MAEKLALCSPVTARDGQTCTAHITRWMLDGHWGDARWMLDSAPRISWTNATSSLCRDAGADLGMLHSGAALSKQGRNPPCHARCHPGRMLQDPPGVIAHCLGGSGKPALPNQEFVLHLL